MFVFVFVFVLNYNCGRTCGRMLKLSDNDQIGNYDYKK